MQTLLEAASHIAQEIERTRQHLINLEQALSGLQPLITIEATTTTLSYTATSFNQSVEDASIVSAEVSKKKAPPSKLVKKAKSKAPMSGKEANAEKTPPRAAAKKQLEISSKLGAKVKPVGKTPVEASPKAKPQTASKKMSRMDAKFAPIVKQKTQLNPDTKVGQQSNVPATGADFWISCAGKKEFNINELTGIALKKLGLEESVKPVIANRARAWITTAIKKGTLLPAGKRAGINSYKRAAL